MATKKDLNSISLTGWLGNNPELRRLADGQAVCDLSIGVHDEVRQTDGSYTDVTEWFKFSQFGQTAEFCAQYLEKGSRVAVSGRLRVERWLDKQHQPQFKLTVIEATITPLDRKPDDDEETNLSNDWGILPEDEALFEDKNSRSEPLPAA